MNKKMQNIAVLIEFIAGSGLAIFFHQVLRYPEAAYTIFGIGVLLSLVTYLLREEIEKTRAELLEQYPRPMSSPSPSPGSATPNARARPTS